MASSHDQGSGRARLLEAARDLFAAGGYAATSIDDVLAVTGLSRGALYHHFANKRELFAAVLEDVESEIAQAVASAASRARSPRKALQTGCEAWLSLARDPTIRQISLVDAPNVLGWETWRATEARHGLGLLRAALSAQADGGHLEPALVDHYAHILLATLIELGLMISRAENPDQAETQARRALSDLLNHTLFQRTQLSPRPLVAKPRRRPGAAR